MRDQERGWIERVVQGEIASAEKVTTGRSRETWLIEVKTAAGERRELVMRRDTGDGPLSGTAISLPRETSVYAALAGTAARVPALVGVSPDGDALLVERAVGSDDLGAIDAPQRRRVLEDLMDALAELHSVPVDQLDLPNFSRPRRPEDHALDEVAFWAGILETKVRRPAGLLAFALRWLAAHPPESVERTVLCHGDFGPGNFLHHDGRVTALLDWEFAHLGDPMDDLAWLTIRASTIGGLDDLSFCAARYRERSGRPVSLDRVRYYQLLVLVRMAIACLAGLEQRQGGMDVSTYFALLPLLEHRISISLAALVGTTLPEVPAPAAGEGSDRLEVLESLSSDLGSVFGPELQSPAARSRLLGSFLLLSHLTAADGLGPSIDAAERQDLSDLLGRPVGSLTDGRRALEDLVRSGAGAEVDLLNHFWRHASRRLALWPAVVGYATKPLPSLE